MQKLVLIVLLAFLISACQSQSLPAAPGAQADAQTQLPAPAIVDRNQVPRIELADAKQHFDAQTAYFVDARSLGEYEEQHIAGAYYVPSIGLEEHLSELPTDKLVITYCT